MSVKEHIAQFLHNKNFLAYMESNVDGQFVDWQITIVFYTALHLIHALAAKKKKHIGAEHKSVNANIDPNNPHAIMPLQHDIYASYKNLYENSRNARYKCWVTNPHPILLQSTLKDCKTFLQKIEADCKSQGIKV